MNFNKFRKWGTWTGNFWKEHSESIPVYVDEERKIKYEIYSESHYYLRNLETGELEPMDEEKLLGLAERERDCDRDWETR